MSKSRSFFLKHRILVSRRISQLGALLFVIKFLISKSWLRARLLCSVRGSRVARTTKGTLCLY